MRRLWPVVLAAPAPAVARIRVVGAMLGFDGRAVRRYPGGRRLVGLRGTRLALLPQRRTIATLGAGEVDDLLVSGRRAAVYQR